MEMWTNRVGLMKERHGITIRTPGNNFLDKDGDGTQNPDMSTIRHLRRLIFIQTKDFCSEFRDQLVRGHSEKID